MPGNVASPFSPDAQAVPIRLSLTAIGRPTSTLHAAINSMFQPSSESALMHGLKWWGAGTNVALKGSVQLQLSGPMVYIFDAAGNSRNDEPAAIDIRLPVSQHEYDSTPGELGYWPRYDRLNPGQRRYYLTWIAQRRVSIPSDLGYLFLFIYGLERRALVEQADHEIIFREVLRLRQLYSASGRLSNHSYESYTSALLWFLLVQRPQSFTLDEVRHLLQMPVMWSAQTLASALYWFSATNTPLTDWAAMRIAQSLPTSHHSDVPNRVKQEFTQLFRARYARWWSDGMLLSPSSCDRIYHYRPSNSALRPIQCVAPDPLDNPSPYQPLSEIWNGCIAELHKLCAIAMRNENAANTAEGWEAMPAELRNGTLHPLTDAFCQILAPHTSVSGVTVVLAAELAPLIGMDGLGKLTADQCRRLSRIASYVGYCVEPDPQVTNRAWKVEQPVAIFLRVTDDTPDISRYPAAACMLQIGVAITSADGMVTESALIPLTQQIADLFELNQAEQRRLDAVRALLLINGAELSLVTRIVKDLPAGHREKMAKLTLALASTDDVITAAELRIIRSVYTSMGIAADEFERAITALKRDDEPTMVVRRGAGKPGEKITAPLDSSTKPLKLNHVAIAEIMRDTREVTEMLAAAMGISGNELQEPEPIPERASDPPPMPQCAQQMLLPQRYAVLYELLIAQSEWTMLEAEVLARKQGLMLSGAIEAINDWSFEVHGGPLFIEEPDRLVVETALLH